MARPRNEELKEKIERQAWGLFRAQGYDATSYAAIAQACGISRNLVQYHVPKKESLAISLMESILRASHRALGKSEADLRGDFAAIYETGTCYFAFLLQSEGYRTFLLDIIRGRDLTESILAFNADWALERVDGPSSDDDLQRVMRSVVVHMGGFYELLYHCLKNDKPFDPGRELHPVMEAFMCALGHDRDEVQTELRRGQLDEKDVQRTVKAMGDELGI